MTVQGHLQQAHRNESLAQRLGIPPLRTYDWAITVLFYSILHFVDAYLLQHYGIVPKDTQRHGIEERGNEFSAVTITLGSTCHRSRLRISSCIPPAGEHAMKGRI